MSTKTLKIIANILFVYTFIIAAVVIYQRISAYLQGGACPVPIQRPWTYSAIASAIISLIIMFYIDKKDKNKSQ